MAEFVTIRTFSNPVEANIVKTKLQDADIYCHLLGEHTVSANPLLSHAVGGIKLQVREEDAEEAEAILGPSLTEYKEQLKCIYCGSHDVDFVSSRKRPAWMKVLTILALGIPLFWQKIYYCNSCGREFDLKEMESR